MSLSNLSKGIKEITIDGKTVSSITRSNDNTILYEKNQLLFSDDSPSINQFSEIPTNSINLYLYGSDYHLNTINVGLSRIELKKHTFPYKCTLELNFRIQYYNSNTIFIGLMNDSNSSLGFMITIRSLGLGRIYPSADNSKFYIQMLDYRNNLISTYKYYSIKIVYNEEDVTLRVILENEIIYEINYSYELLTETGNKFVIFLSQSNDGGTSIIFKNITIKRSVI